MAFVFGEYRLDPDRRELRLGNDLIALEPQVFDLLVYLVKNRDRVVSKGDVLAAVWGGRLVSESTLTSRVNSLRSAIGDTGEQQRLVRTIPRRGLRFVGEVREVEAESSSNVATAMGRAPAQLPYKPSIAVLPFSNTSGDAEQEYFSDGITEEIIFALSRLHWLFVIARNSTFVFKGKAHDVASGSRTWRALCIGRKCPQEWPANSRH